MSKRHHAVCPTAQGSEGARHWMFKGWGCPGRRAWRRRAWRSTYFLATEAKQHIVIVLHIAPRELLPPEARDQIRGDVLLVALVENHVQAFGVRREQQHGLREREVRRGETQGAERRPVGI